MENLHSFTVEGKIAMITGSARGIGRACCLALAEAGARGIVAGLRDIDQDSGLVEELRQYQLDVLTVQMDVSDKSQIDYAVDQAIRHFGKIDILVNNAGIAPSNLIENYTETDFDQTLAVNLKGTFFTSQAVGRHMMAQQFGRIINLSSQAGFIALREESVYCMTKAGIAHLTKCFAAEWAPYNINVNAVAPTFIETPGTDPWLADPAFKESVVSRILLKKIGKPADVSSAVVFLASPAANMITGTTLMIDGGWTVV